MYSILSHLFLKDVPNLKCANTLFPYLIVLASFSRSSQRPTLPFGTMLVIQIFILIGLLCMNNLQQGCGMDFLSGENFIGGCENDEE